MTEPGSGCDALVIGQGLAGSCVAWVLHQAGLRPVLVDADEHAAAWQVAAGLITPITGRRFVRAADFQPHLTAADALYRAAERLTDASFFQHVTTLRLFADEEEREFFTTRRLDRYRDDVQLIAPHDGNAGGFEMPAARLRTRDFVLATRAFFRERQQFETARIEADRDLEFRTDGIRLRQRGISAAAVICCTGWWQRDTAFFPDIPDSPCRGDVLHLRIDGYDDQRVRNRGIWIAPEGDGTYLAGSTYDWTQLSPQPSRRGREKILRQVRDITGCEAEVLGHQAAVRPAMKAARPVIRRHPTDPRIVALNGLGARGALWAPRQAELVVRELFETSTDAADDR